MKRLLTSAALFLCSLITFAQFSGSGSGTEEDPYLIFNETQLAQVSNFLSQEGVVFSLMKDLDLTNWVEENNPRQGWLPIGVETMPFMGKFLGNNHKISGLMIKRSSTEYVGFFGYISAATIENLTIEGSSVTGASNVGGFIGFATGSEITNCHLSLTSGVEGTSKVGGFIGQSIHSNFSSFNATASVTGQSYIGGFVGLAEGGTWQQGSITGQLICTDNYAGGFAGQLISVSVTDIKQNGDLSGQDYVGGFVGCCSTGTFTNCFVESNVQGLQNVSGFAGALENTTSSFNSCFHKGTITAKGDYCGGIVGVSKGGCIEGMESCSHFGDIVGQSFVGGLIGAMLNIAEEPILHTYSSNDKYGNNIIYNETINTGELEIKDIKNCLAIGNFTGNNYLGGLIGSDITSKGFTTTEYSTVDNSYYEYYSQNGNLKQRWRYVYYYDENGYQLGTTVTYYIYARNTISLSFTNNYYCGTLQGIENVGGIAGLKSGSSIQNNYSNSTIYGTTNVGGIVGKISDESDGSFFATTTIKSNVANISTISATGQNVGRIYGIIDEEHTTIGALGSSESNRALAQAKVILSGVTQDIDDDLQNGTSIGPSALKLKANYVSWGWNFDENWNILETESYPYKKYQAAPPVIESNLVSQVTSISGKSVDGGTVYLFYKDRNAVSTECSGNLWNFTTEPLQSGAQVQIYADVEGLVPSYFTTANVGYPGSGTEEDPYRIYTAEDLQGASNRGYYQVMNDIDLTSWIAENSPEKGWVPIGRNSGDATYIDGAGHTISGLWIDSTEDFTGLFSNYSAGQIKNLTVEVAKNKSVKGGNYTGILIGRMANGTILNCQVNGDVEGSKNVGGITGYSEATTLSTLSFEGMVKTTAEKACVGGIAGQAKSSPATNCTTYTTINATNSSVYAGGLMGLYEDGLISKCMADVIITTTGANSNVGGLVGCFNGDVQLSLSKGIVSATGTGSNTGGLMGYARTSTITNCYSTANVNGTDFTAGLVGYAYSSAIDKCYAKGNVTGVQYGAGVVGELEAASATLTNSVAVNNILSLTAQSSWGSRVIGGFKNGAPMPDESNYALATMQVSLNNVPQNKTDDLVEGIAMTETELKQAATYQILGWDYSTIWGIDEGQTYPYLLWEVDANPVVDITLDKTSLLIAVGKTETINASIMPLEATNKRLDWTTSDANVATVEDGVVTAVGVGSAIITAAATDGSGVSTTCRVTVIENMDVAIAELQALVDEAQALYDNSTEGDDIGQYAPGSRAALLAVINSVRDQISNTMDEETISDCMEQLNNAIALFESQRVTPGEDTDYSVIDNTLYIERVEASAGGQVTLSIKMKNTVGIQGYQFDLFLPDGVTVAKNANGKPMVSLSTERTTTNDMDYFRCSLKPDGQLTVMCASTEGYTFEGNDGEVALVTLDVSDDMEEGEYAIVLKDVVLTDANATAHETEYLKSTLEVFTYKLGDVNADTKINVADFVAVANHILGNTPSVFVYKAADVNKDTKINVADFVGIANMILNGVTSANQGRMMLAPKRADSVTPTDIDELDNAIYIDPAIAAQGSQQVLSVKMKNAGEVVGFQFQVQLPEGLTFENAVLSTERTTTDKTDYFKYKIQQNGTMIVMGSSTGDPDTGEMYAIDGNDGEIVCITVNVPADFEAGEYAIHVQNGVLTDSESIPTELEEDIVSQLTIEESDGRIHFAETDASLPAYTAGDKGDITMARTINAGEWSTIVLPFNLTRANATKVFGDDVQFAKFTGFEVDYGDDEENVTPLGITLKFDSYTIPARGNLAGGTPVLIKTGKNISEIKLDDVTLVRTVSNVETTDDDYGFPGKFIGTFVKTTVPEDGLFLSDNKFWYSTGKTNIKAFRGWFELGAVLNKETDFGANLNFVIDGDPTTIDGIPGNMMIRKGDVYTIQGQYVGHNVDMKRLPSGIYIVDGKKMVIK